MEVSARSFAGLKQRRRTLAGRTGCGVCGTESLDQRARLCSRTQSPAQCVRCARQHLNQATGSVHAAAWCSVDGAVQMLREGVGRHNALDKLIGALAGASIAATDGFIAVTSRTSIEMVQKSAVAGVPLLAAVSAPTLLAVETAGAAGKQGPGRPGAR
jgi:FdhD protein